jgi:hypothetical protein
MITLNFKSTLFSIAFSVCAFGSQPGYCGDSASADQNDKLMATVYMKDGSRLVGNLSVKKWKIRTGVSDSLVSLDLLESVDFENDADQTQFSFNNGDRLTGIMEEKSVEIKTSFSLLVLPKEQIHEIFLGSAAIKDEASKNNPGALGFQQYFKCMKDGDAVGLGDTVTAKGCLDACKKAGGAGCWWLDGTGGFPRGCNLCSIQPPQKGSWSNDWGIVLGKNKH